MFTSLKATWIALITHILLGIISHGQTFLVSRPDCEQCADTVGVNAIATFGPFTLTGLLACHGIDWQTFGIYWRDRTHTGIEFAHMDGVFTIQVYWRPSPKLHAGSISWGDIADD